MKIALMRIGSLFGIQLLVLVTGLGSWQQPSHKEEHEQQPPLEFKKTTQAALESKNRRDEDIQALTVYARMAPPEFAADALIRIAESRRVKDQKWKCELLEEAFQVAARVQNPTKRTVVPGGAIDTRSGYLSNAYRLNLDAVSLRCQAVKAMLAVDKRKARKLFVEIPKLELHPLNCEDSLVCDLSGFYETLSTIALTTFSLKEMRRDEHVRFVDLYIEGIVSPVQIEPAAKVILSLKTSPSQLGVLVHTFSTALRRISGDDRSFSVPWVSPVAVIDPLVRTCNDKGVSADELLESFREYLVKHFSANRCADTASRTQQRSMESNLIDYFNNHLRLATYSRTKLILPLSEDDIKPAKIEGVAVYDPYWRSSKAKSLLSRLQKLRFASNGKNFTDAEKQEPEWRWQLSQLLTDLTSWSQADEKSEADYFHQKSILYYGLLEVVPQGSTRDDVLSDFIASLSDSTLQEDSPIEWFLHAKYIVDMARNSQNPERSKVIEALNHSRSATLYLYAQMEVLITESKQEAR